MTKEQKSLTCHLLDRKGGGREIGGDDIERLSPDDGLLWAHLDYTEKKNQNWIRKKAGLPRVVCDALLAEDTRPTYQLMKEGLLVILRGVNLNPEHDPEDMISIRLWVEEHRIISTYMRRLLSVEDIRRLLADGSGPQQSGEFLVEIAARLISRMAIVIDETETAIDTMEEEMLEKESRQIQLHLTARRMQIITLRRFLAPQREVLVGVAREKISWFGETERIRLSAAADQVTRYVENLDLSRDRAQVIREELVSRLSEQMEKRMYMLSLVALIFLPLGFLTGLLGVNVGGIPGTEYRWAFAIVCLLMLAVLGVQVAILKRLKWF